MTSNKKLLFSVAKFGPILAFFIVSGCASIQRPMGGPRDRTPPKLLKAVPANQTRNFSAKTITLTFDEYFRLVSQYQEITMSPEMVKPPEYLIKQKTLQIKLKDTLAKNTTYVINFGKAIADVNEGNVLKNFTYVFSTGPHIDSLNIAGNVSNLETGDREKDVTVMLFPLKQDTAYYGKKKPAIYTTTDTAGNFKLSNLKEGDYTIYALKETSPNKIYDNENELIAFKKTPIHLHHDTADVNMKLFKQIPQRLRLLSRSIDADGKLTYLFNKGLENPGAHILDSALNAEKIAEFSRTGDTASIYLRHMNFDSVKVAFLSNGKAQDTVVLRRSKRDTYKRKIEVGFNTNTNLLKPGTDLIVTANYPLDNVDQSRVTLVEDSVEVDDYKITRDKNDLKKFSISYKWKPDRFYDFSFSEAALIDIYGDKNKLITKRVTLDKPDNYSTLTLKVTLPDTGKNYIVQLLNAGGFAAHTDYITKSQALVYKNYPTGTYRVKIIYDTNRNGKWDTGNVKQKIQPEYIWLYKKDITLRANFDIDQVITVPKEVVIP